jgi:hypothetical protein|tara:strand:+ start:5710 stop:5901 length:192 start_codon:yes stop_codon:yes gene_type:complete
MIISTFIGSIVGSIVTITLYPCAKKLKYRRDMKKFIAGEIKNNKDDIFDFIMETTPISTTKRK